MEPSASESDSWLLTPDGQRRGYIQPQTLKELWLHTGTICNLSCPFCLEGSKPGDDRLERMTFDDARPWLDDAAELGVERFSFTGGEPFVVKDIFRILTYALRLRPCLVLTNGTDPLLRRLEDVVPLAQMPHPISFRISLDYPDPVRHDRGRGEGGFAKSLECLRRLREKGFETSVARQMEEGEKREAVEKEYRRIFRQNGLPEDLRLVAFPDFLTPGSLPQVPDITEDCMTRYHNQETRGAFMCNFSKMLVKKAGRVRVYACTLVDDDPDYDLGGNLRESLAARVMLKHHRCYSCFALGSSCSEL